MHYICVVLLEKEKQWICTFYSYGMLYVCTVHYMRACVQVLQAMRDRPLINSLLTHDIVSCQSNM